MWRAIDPIFSGWFKHRATILRPVGDDFQVTAENLPCLIDRPANALTFNQLIVTPNYSHRIFLSYRYRDDTTNQTLELTDDIVKEGDHLIATYDGRERRFVVVRRYNPADLNRHLTLEVREQSPTGAIEPLNP